MHVSMCRPPSLLLLQWTRSWIIHHWSKEQKASAEFRAAHPECASVEELVMQLVATLDNTKHTMILVSALVRVSVVPRESACMYHPLRSDMRARALPLLHSLCV